MTPRRGPGDQHGEHRTGGPVVLVTGAATPVAAAVVRALLAADGVGGVVALDERLPHEDLGGSRFVRVDVRSPSLSRVLAAERADVVVDAALLAGPQGAGATTRSAADAAAGSQSLLHAVRRAGCVRRVVVASSTAVYGAGARSPAVFTEDREPVVAPRSGSGRAAVEVEGTVRGFARRHPEVSVAVLRLVDVLGPGVRTALGDWLELPLVPSAVGHDPRLQVLHVEDAVRALALAALGDVTGVVNVAGDGVVTLGQAAALCGRPLLPVPAGAAVATARSLAGSRGRVLGPVPWGLAEDLLRSGRVVDTGRMRADLGLSPRWSGRAAVEDLARGRGLTGPLAPEVRASAARRLALLAARAGLLAPRRHDEPWHEGWPGRQTDGVPTGPGVPRPLTPDPRPPGRRR